MPAGCEREHARPVHLRAQKTTGGQRDVPHHLRFHPEPWTASQQPVVRVALGERGRHHRRLPVGRRGDDQAEERLLAPALLDEFGGQPVEQFRMRRPGALRAEVLAGLDEAAAEHLLPESIDGHARDERIAARPPAIARARAG